MANSIFMERTRVSAEQTAQEIVAALAKNGAKSVTTDYDGGLPSAIEFTLKVSKTAIRYKLPARTKEIRKAFLRYGRKPPNEATCEAIGWRQLLRWVEAQLALIECGMTSAEETFMPYAQSAAGQTMFEAWQSQVRLLEAPKEPGR